MITKAGTPTPILAPRTTNCDETKHYCDQGFLYSAFHIDRNKELVQFAC